jgi:hypothetical protein
MCIYAVKYLPRSTFILLKPFGQGLVLVVSNPDYVAMAEAESSSAVSASYLKMTMVVLFWFF